MAKEKNQPAATRKTMSGKLVYKEQDSRKGTYHPYIINSSDGMVGTIYFPKSKDVPDFVEFEVEG